MRQQEQQKIKDEKTQREVDFFWQWQEQIKQWDDERGGPPKLGQRRLKEEEWELFSSHNGSVGINFQQYDDIPVDIAGRGAKEIPSIASFEDLCLPLPYLGPPEHRGCLGEYWAHIR